MQCPSAVPKKFFRDIVVVVHISSLDGSNNFGPAYRKIRRQSPVRSVGGASSSTLSARHLRL
jgi:hypothetical protein